MQKEAATSMTITDQQQSQARAAFDLAAINGIASLAAGLRARGMLNDAQLESLHGAMTKPLEDLAVADNPAVQMMLAHLDETLSGIGAVRFD